MTHRFRTCFSLLTLGLLSLGIAPVRADTYNAGVAEFTATHPDGSRNLNGHVWYPTHHEGAEDIVQDSKVWRTISGHRDAPVASGAHPVVLMSHGMYGNALNQAWLAQELARAGVVSVLPNHPGTTTFDRDPAAARHLWLRATDLGVSLDAVIADARFGDHLDVSRVAAAGHSLGGYTVMAAAGARHDPVAFAHYCAIVPMRPDCQAIAMWQVGADPREHTLLQSDRSDSRLKTVMIFDLGGTQIFEPASLGRVAIPVLVLGSGRQDMLIQDVESRALVAALPAGQVTHIELVEAGHFDFMGECIEGGYDILAREEPGDEMVCIHGTKHRAAQHRRISAIVIAHLRATGVMPTE